jgi:hypothetical protein
MLDVKGPFNSWRGAIPTSRDTQDLVRRSELVYEERLKAALESTHRDYFVAIEPDSGDYFLGQTLSEAAAAARQVYPDRRAYVLRVGHPVTVYIGGCRLNRNLDPASLLFLRKLNKASSEFDPVH